MSRMKFITAALLSVAILPASAQIFIPTQIWDYSGNVTRTVMSQLVYQKADAYPSICHNSVESSDRIATICTTSAPANIVHITTREIQGRLVSVSMVATPTSDGDEVATTLDAMFASYLKDKMTDDEILKQSPIARRQLLARILDKSDAYLSYPDLKVHAHFETGNLTVDFTKPQQ